MKLLRIFLVCCALLAAFTAAGIWRDRHNALEKYPEWRSAKTELALGVNGAHAFLFAPITLLGRALNLGAWLGHQELALDRAFPAFPELSLRLQAEGESEWTLLARPHASGAAPFGLRLSSRPERPSAWLSLGGERRIFGRRLIPITLPSGEWTRVELARRGELLELSVKGLHVSTLPVPPGAWRFSFYGSSSSGVMRMDELRMGGGEVVYEQGFGGVFPWWLFALVCVALSALLLGLHGLAGPGPAVAVAAGLAMLSCLLLLFYDATIGNQYPQSLDYRVKSMIESHEEVKARLAALPPGPPVLLWLGGSQAWGAGASRPELSAFGRLSARLSSAKLELLNGAASGTMAEQQLEAVRIVEKRRKIAALVVITGVNDTLNDQFQEKLALLAGEAARLGAKLLLVAEPSSPPASQAIRLRQRQLAEFAVSRRLPFVPLQPVLDREADSGFHWWDFVHLSDSGAAIAARELEGPIRKLIATPR